MGTGEAAEPPWQPHPFEELYFPPLLAIAIWEVDERSKNITNTEMTPRRGIANHGRCRLNKFIGLNQTIHPLHSLIVPSSEGHGAD